MNIDVICLANSKNETLRELTKLTLHSIHDSEKDFKFNVHLIESCKEKNLETEFKYDDVVVNEITPEEMERTLIEMENMDREFNKTKLNYIANTLKEAVNRMEYTGDMSDLGNEIGVTVGHAYENMTEENINDFISGFRHGVSLTNGTH